MITRFRLNILMKIIIKFQPLIICITTILFSSCVSDKYSFVVNENNPPDQNASIFFQHYYMNEYHTIKKWNSINIEKYISKPGFNGKLIIPAGNNTIIFDVDYLYDYDKKIYTFKNVELQYNFKPGKKYEVKSKEISMVINYSKYLQSNELNVELLICLYDITGERTLLKQWKVTKLWYPTIDDFLYPKGRGDTTQQGN